MLQRVFTRGALVAGLLALAACSTDSAPPVSDTSDVTASPDVASLLPVSPTTDLDALRVVADGLSADGVSLALSAPSAYAARYPNFFGGVTVLPAEAPDFAGEASDAFLVSPADVQFDEALALTIHFDPARFDSERVEVLSWNEATQEWLSEPVVERAEGRIIALTARTGLVRLAAPERAVEPAVVNGAWRYLSEDRDIASEQKGIATQLRTIRVFGDIDTTTQTLCLAYGGITTGTETFALIRPGSFKATVPLAAPSTGTMRVFVSDNADCSTVEGDIYPSPAVDFVVNGTTLSETTCDEGMPPLANFVVDPGADVSSFDGVQCPSSDIDIPAPIDLRLQNLAVSLAPGRVACADFAGTVVPGTLSGTKWRAEGSAVLPTTVDYRWFESSSTACTDVIRPLLPGSATLLANNTVVGDDACEDAGETRVARLSIDASGGVLDAGTLDCLAGLGLDEVVEFRLQTISDMPDPGQTVCIEVGGNTSIVPLAGNKYRHNEALTLPNISDFLWFYSDSGDCSSIDQEVYPGQANTVVANVSVRAGSCVDAVPRSLQRVRINGFTDVETIGTEECVGASGETSISLFFQVFDLMLAEGESLHLDILGTMGTDGDFRLSGTKYKLLTSVGSETTDVDTVVNQFFAGVSPFDGEPTDVLLFNLQTEDEGGIVLDAELYAVQNYRLSLGGRAVTSCVLIDADACTFANVATSDDNGASFRNGSGPGLVACPGEEGTDLDMDDRHDACNPLCVPTGDEVCDGVDNDCNGQIDDMTVDAGEMCDTGASGVCGAGATVCEGGTLLCEQTVFPSEERCDGFDNDCDDFVDEDAFGTGEGCDTGSAGVCAAGTTVCVESAIVCEPNVLASAEICDGLDNDCDASVDEEPSDVGGACNTGQLGACDAGVSVCVMGSVDCMQTVFPSEEVCDGIDNDCDGTTDVDDLILFGAPIGECTTDADCTDPSRPKCTLRVCTAGSGGCETDADCADPDNPTCDLELNVCGPPACTDDSECPLGRACTLGVCSLFCDTGLEGVCALGAPSCEMGDTVCQQIALPTEEICDGLDNDCDDQTDEGFDADMDDVADCFDECPGGDDSVDSDGDGTADFCDATPCALCMGPQSTTVLQDFEGGSWPDASYASLGGTDAGVVGPVDGSANNALSDTIDTFWYDTAIRAGETSTVSLDFFVSDFVFAAGDGPAILVGASPAGGVAAYADFIAGGFFGSDFEVGFAEIDASGTASVVSSTSYTLDVSTWYTLQVTTSPGLNVVEIYDAAGGLVSDNAGGAGAGYAGCFPMGGIGFRAGTGGYGGIDDFAFACPGPEVCGDMIDNDNDGSVDCEDIEDCAMDPECDLSCTAPEADCNMEFGDGCEVDLENDPNNCGACAVECLLPNVAANSCNGGECEVGACIMGYEDCDLDPTNGCEVDTFDSVENCGTCGVPCAGANVSSYTCNGGICEVMACEPRFDDCDADPTNGCEANVFEDPSNCGICGNDCGPERACIAGGCFGAE